MFALLCTARRTSSTAAARVVPTRFPLRERELRARVHRAGDGPVDVGRFATLCHYKFCTSIRTESRFVEHPATRTAGRHRRLPEHDRHPDRGRRRGGARAPRAAPRERLRARRHRRRRARPRPPPRRRQRRGARGAAPRRRRRRADGRPRAAPRRGRGAARREPAARADARARARVPRRRRGDSRAARRRRVDRTLPALDHRAGSAGGHRRLLTRPVVRAEGRGARDDRRRGATRKVLRGRERRWAS